MGILPDHLVSFDLSELEEECKCDCHDPEKGKLLRHIAPCCLICECCGRNIKAFYYEKHIEKCNLKPAI